jgi:hypothetical protein
MFTVFFQDKAEAGTLEYMKLDILSRIYATIEQSIIWYSPSIFPQALQAG